ncbi:MAG: CDC48 family AAA ATPase [Polyangia bacterium]
MLRLRVTEALPKDVGRALVRIDPEDAARLHAQIGDVVEILGTRRTAGKVMPTYRELRGQGRVQIDGVTRDNAGVGLDQAVELRRVTAPPAERVQITAQGLRPGERDLEYIGHLLDGLPVTEGDLLRAALFGSRTADFRVEAVEPRGPALITPRTRLVVAATPAQAAGANEPRARPEAPRPPSYEDIGGLRSQLTRIREMIELPLRFPEVFERLGVDPPRGVLLYGPPGCGKTLIARAIAHEVSARFFVVSGPEVIHKFYGESEAHLRKLFEEAAKQGPSILFLDEIDAIAPSRERVTGEVEKRVVAQLLALMDGLSRRHNVVVIGATNLPNHIDPALRRPGRFDREITIPVPDRFGRGEILEIHSRGMPLASDVELGTLAERTHGFVGADLAALCREAAMRCLRRLLPDIDFAAARLPYDQLLRLTVRMADFEDALRSVEPSALREVFVEIPSVRWGDVGGLGPIKQALIEAVVWPRLHAARFRAARLRPPRGVLLCGPPGCGKTLLARAVATESGVNFISVKGPQLVSKFVGESERALRELFRTARQAAPCVVFFDELDALVSVRSGGSAGGTDSSGVTDRLIGQLLTELDGVEDLGGVQVLGATNRPERIDPALLRPGRFDLVLTVPPPDREGRREILEVHLRGRPLRGDIDVPALAEAAAGLSGAELAAVIDHAALAAVRRAIASAEGERGGGEREVALAQPDLHAALAAVRSRL